jgi:hypothetical protein
MVKKTIKVSGLTPLEVRELEKTLGRQSVEELGTGPRSANFPEPTTFLIAGVVLSSAALNALAIIAARPKRTAKRVLRIEYESEDKTYSVELEEDLAASESPSPKVIEKITKGLSLDPKTLASLNKDD